MQPMRTVRLEHATDLAGFRHAARTLVQAGIPVVGHVGLTPQTAVALGGYRAQGRTAQAALAVIDDALALQDAGCSMLVVEAVPAEVTAALVPLLDIPVIGIGAGADTDGQVLVFHDLLGLYDGGAAKFVKRYADLRAAVDAYEKQILADTMARCRFNQKIAAEALGLSYDQIRHALKKHGLN